MHTCLIAGYASGKDSVERALIWCENHIEVLLEHMELKNEVASEPTISRMLNETNEEMFALDL